MSKGSSPRPFSVSQEKFDINWNSIFKKENKMQVRVSEKKEIGGCGCGRSPTGRCIGWHGLTESAYKQALEKYTQENGENNK